MFSPYLGFNERSIVGVYKVAAAMASGLAVMSDTSDASPATPSTYGNSFGSVVAATTTTAGGRIEVGWLLQPVTTNGPSVLSLISNVYDESVAAGMTAAVVLHVSGAQIATDQYVASGTGLLNASTAIDTRCSYLNGQPRVTQTGDADRLVFKGFVNQRNSLCGVFAVI